MRSSSASEPQTQVVVIGAGPSGLFAAAELARHGVPPLVVERQPVPHREARATALQPGTLEILARAGVVDRVLAASVHLGCARVFDADLRRVGELAFAGVGCPWEFQCSLPQWRTERILAERLVELGGVVERGVAASSLEERDDGVLVRLERADGTPETVEAGWVIGAGGAHSVTRISMAEALEGVTYPGRALAADVRVHCDLPRDGSNLIAAPEGYVLLAPLPDERWITFVGDLDDGEAERLAGATPHDAVAAAIERRVDQSALRGAVARLTEIVVERRPDLVTDAFRKVKREGRVMLDPSRNALTCVRLSDDEVAARRLLARHARALERETDPRRRRQRAYALLARNGFSPDVASHMAARTAEPVDDEAG